METSGSTPRPDGNGQAADDGAGFSAEVQAAWNPVGDDVSGRDPEAVPELLPGGPAVGPEPAQVRSGATHLFGYLAIYTVLRLGLIIVLTVLLAFFMPLIVALLFAIIVQLPLSWLLFAGPRRRVNEAIAQSSARRRAERARLQSALSGDEPER